MGEIPGAAALGEDSWAWVVLPPELLEIVWALVPPQQRALLSKSFYLDWKTDQLTALARGHQTHMLARVVRRQVKLNHEYTFGVLLDLRGKAWNQLRPWRSDMGKYASFLWYLESVCAQSGRHEMRSNVRHAINRYEGPSAASRKGVSHRDGRGSIRRRQWTSFG
jgi:hypothetical protein